MNVLFQLWGTLVGLSAFPVGYSSVPCHTSFPQGGSAPVKPRVGIRDVFVQALDYSGGLTGPAVPLPPPDIYLHGYDLSGLLWTGVLSED